jgi:hypothetical protein
MPHPREPQLAKVDPRDFSKITYLRPHSSIYFGEIL